MSRSGGWGDGGGCRAVVPGVHRRSGFHRQHLASERYWYCIIEGRGCMYGCAGNAAVFPRANPQPCLFVSGWRLARVENHSKYNVQYVMVACAHACMHVNKGSIFGALNRWTFCSVFCNAPRPFREKLVCMFVVVEIVSYSDCAW